MSSDHACRPSVCVCARARAPSLADDGCIFGTLPIIMQIASAKVILCCVLVRPLLASIPPFPNLPPGTYTETCVDCYIDYTQRVLHCTWSACCAH